MLYYINGKYFLSDALQWRANVSSPSQKAEIPTKGDGMGQYQLWLQHREIDQLLRAQLKTLVNELAQVDERMRILANSTLQVDNVIVQALLQGFQVEAS